MNRNVASAVFGTLILSVLFPSTLLLGAALAQGETPVLAFTVTSESVEGPDSLEAGYYRVVAEAEGETEADVQIFRVREDVTAEEVAASFDAMVNARGEAAGEALAEAIGRTEALVGGVGFPPAVVRLEPGTYYATVYGPEEGGASYASQGLLKRFTVTEAASALQAPEADFAVAMADFAFAFPAEMPAGEQTWEVRNAGEQVHHLVLFRVKEGKTAEDVGAFLQLPPGEASGPPPFEPAGVVNLISPGQSVFVTFDLEAGTYVAVCFLPDYETGVPHVAKGMIAGFSVP